MSASDAKKKSLYVRIVRKFSEFILTREDPEGSMKSVRENKETAESPEVIGEKSFLSAVTDSMRPLLGLAKLGRTRPGREGAFTRPFLARLGLESMRIEETLDACGARNNRSWFPFRELVAATKIFSQAAYMLLHLRFTTPVYQLLPIEEDFPQATDAAIDTLTGIIEAASKELLRTARKIGLPDVEADNGEDFRDLVPSGGLPVDRTRRHIEEPGKTVCYLATAFLNLSEESRLLEIHKNVQEEEYALCIPDSINEEALRELENKFHNLQSLYDTNISNSDIEDQDRNLRIMRGHVSIIFHLLETATAFSHYYERHLHLPTEEMRWPFHYPVSPETLLRVLMTYSIAFAYRFMKAAQDLCHNILRVYAEEGRIEVPVPNYRGFHVRPSTLVAKIIAHYGSKVEMLLEDEVYDASRPLELFRANEQINAKKRRFIAEELASLPAVQEWGKAEGADLKEGLKEIWVSLLSHHRVVVYDQDFTYNDLEPFEDETLIEYAKRWVAHCLALGKIDVDTNILVTFAGDKRVLEDIKLLVENGYGEDKFGNNVVLPAKLSYLRR